MTGFSARWVPVHRPAARGPGHGPDAAIPRLRPGADLRARRRRPRRPALARGVPGHSCVLASHEERRGHDRADVPPARRGSRRVPLAGGIPQVLPAEARRRGRQARRPEGEAAGRERPPRPPSRPSRRNSSRRRSGPSWRRNAASATRAPPRSCGAGSGSTAGRASASGATPARRSCPATPTRACSSGRSATATTSSGCPPRRSSPTRSSPTSRPGSRWAPPTRRTGPAGVAARPSVDLAKGREFWSFRPPKKSAPPAGEAGGLAARRHRPLPPRGARSPRARPGRRRRPAEAPSPGDVRPHRPAAHARGARRLPRGRLPRRLRQGRRSAARLAPLRRALGPALARRGAVRRVERQDELHLPPGLALPRLGDRLVQRRQAVRPVRPRADRRRPPPGR